MPMTLQVLYPTAGETTFNHAYYADKHMEIVTVHMSEHFDSSIVTKGVAGGPDVPAGYHAVATFVFATQAKLDACLAAAGPAVGDIPNFYSGQPEMLIGEAL